MEEYYSVPSLAKAMGISRAWVHRLVKEKVIVGIRLGRYSFIAKDEGEKWIKEFKEHGRYKTFPRNTILGRVKIISGENRDNSL